MATASLEGQWVLLQNTHLGLSYLTEVETFLVGLLQPKILNPNRPSWWQQGLSLPLYFTYFSRML